MNVLVCPDKFKGSLSAREAAEAIARGVKRALPKADIVLQPLADGGEGSLDLLRRQPGLKERRITVPGPLRKAVRAKYLLGNGKALIETAAACGLHLVPPPRRHPSSTTTIGVGTLIDDALARGAHDITLFLGGSATNDGGAGMAAALGYRFYGKRGEDFVPMADSLKWVDRIDYDHRLPAIEKASFTAVCDVTAPLLGEQGATLTYARQKGAEAERLLELERNMTHFAYIIERDLSIDIRHLPGAGAAGGLGAGTVAFLGAELQQGISAIFAALDFTSLAERADLVITGEGKIDRQTLQGKVVAGVVSYGKPTIAVCGSTELSAPELGVARILSILPDPYINLTAATVYAARYLEQRVYDHLASNHYT